MAMLAYWQSLLPLWKARSLPTRKPVEPDFFHWYPLLPLRLDLQEILPFSCRVIITFTFSPWF